MRSRNRILGELALTALAEAAQRVGRSPQTVRRWIRDGRLSAITQHGRHAIEPADLDGVRDELYPMLELPRNGSASRTERRCPTGPPRLPCRATDGEARR